MGASRRAVLGSQRCLRAESTDTNWEIRWLNAVLNLDLPADFHEILRRNVEQVHCPHRIAEHQREQAQRCAHQPAAPF